jgi:hypothetical protein
MLIIIPIPDYSFRLIPYSSAVWLVFLIMVNSLACPLGVLHEYNTKTDPGARIISNHDMKKVN